MTRGCGKRKPGGVYICTKLSPHGVPLEEFIIDPPEAYEGERVPGADHFREERKEPPPLLGGQGVLSFPFRLYRGGAALRRVEAGAGGVPDPEAERGVPHVLRPLPRDHKEPRRASAATLCPKRLKSHLSNETYCLGHSYQVAPANSEGRRKVGDTVYDVKPVTPDTPLEFAPGDIPTASYHRHRSRRLQGRKARPEGEGKGIRNVKIPLNYTFE